MSPDDPISGQMRFFYLDPGLRDDVGHHANYCRYIVGELKSRGTEVLVFGHREMSPSLQAELGATAHFRVYTYEPYAVWRGWRGWLTDCANYCRFAAGELRSGGLGTLGFRRHEAFPLRQSALGTSLQFCAHTCARHGDWRGWRGWFTAFASFTQITCEDLLRLPTPEPHDVVFAPSARPAQMSALIRWRRILPPKGRPTVIVDCVNTGLVVRKNSDCLVISMPDPRYNPIAVLLRHVGRQLPREDEARFHVTTFASRSTELFKLLLQYPVRTLPLPYRAVAPLRKRAGARPVVVAILGHQRNEKGYEQLPEIIRALLRLNPDIRILVQCVAPLGSPKTQQALREIAARSDRVVLEETPAGKTRWRQLLEMSDLVLCPHRPEFYGAGFSAVAAEALANGIPLVVPADTPLEALVAACGGPGAAFDRFEPASIAEATGRVLDQFDRFATLAHDAALSWPETRGPARMVEELMSLIATSQR